MFHQFVFEKMLAIVVSKWTMISSENKNNSARFSQKEVSGKKPPTSKNLAAHLEILPLTPKKLVAKIANKT